MSTEITEESSLSDVPTASEAERADIFNRRANVNETIRPPVGPTEGYTEVQHGPVSNYTPRADLPGDGHRLVQSWSIRRQAHGMTEYTETGIIVYDRDINPLGPLSVTTDSWPFTIAQREQQAADADEQSRAYRRVNVQRENSDNE